MKTAQLKKMINSNVELIKPQLGEMTMSFYLYDIDSGIVQVDVIKERQGVRFKLNGDVISAKKLDCLNFKVSL